MSCDPVSTPQQLALIDLVRQVAREEILGRFRKLRPGDVKCKTALDDLVTKADSAAEARLFAGIKTIYPDAAIVGEEAAAADPAVLKALESDLCVIIDPVDGTWNYASGLACFGVLVAMAEAGEVRWGLLYDPLMDDWVVTRKGKGTWFAGNDMDSERLLFSKSTRNPASAFVPKYFFLHDAGETLVSSFRRDGTLVHSIRCSCHEYRALLSGAVDFNICEGLKPWDHAAGTLAVREAGGTCRVLPDRNYSLSVSSGYMVVAGTAALANDMAAKIHAILSQPTHPEPTHKA